MNKQTSLSIKNLSFSYQKDKNIIEHLNLEIPQGFSLLIGPTGSGKSTLLKIIAGLYPDFAGNMTGTIDLHQQKVAMMFQNASEQFTMATAREEIIFALENLELDKDEYQTRLSHACDFSNISNLLDRKITTLSGGEKQRVALAVLVAMDTDIFLLDEPFASCDPNNRAFLIKQLANLSELGKTIIISDHLFNDYQDICDRVYRLEKHTVNLLSPNEQDLLFKNTQLHKTYKFMFPNFEKKAIFSLQNTQIYQNRLLLNQDKLEIFSGNTLIIGPNGSGKTSFFNALTKMLPYKGQLGFKNKEIKNLKSRSYLRKVGQVFQNATDQFLAITVKDEIELSKKNRNSYFSDTKIAESLKLLELDNHLDQVVYTLSGGQKKKLQILLMLMCQHEVLLFDEPLAGLDQKSISVILCLMRESQKSTKQSFLIISHQIDALSKFCNYSLIFCDQKLKYLEEVTQ